MKIPQHEDITIRTSYIVHLTCELNEGQKQLLRSIHPPDMIHLNGSFSKKKKTKKKDSIKRLIKKKQKNKKMKKENENKSLRFNYVLKWMWKKNNNNNNRKTRDRIFAPKINMNLIALAQCLYTYHWFVFFLLICLSMKYRIYKCFIFHWISLSSNLIFRKIIERKKIIIFLTKNISGNLIFFKLWMEMFGEMEWINEFQCFQN